MEVQRRSAMCRGGGAEMQTYRAGADYCAAGDFAGAEVVQIAAGGCRWVERCRGGEVLMWRGAEVMQIRCRLCK